MSEGLYYVADTRIEDDEMNHETIYALDHELNWNTSMLAMVMKIRIMDCQ